jgi:hypothetical protein
MIRTSISPTPRCSRPDISYSKLTGNMPTPESLIFASHNSTVMHDSIISIAVSSAVTMKNAVFWDVTPCGSCKNRGFEGTYRLHHQGGERSNISLISNRITLPKRLFLQEPHGIISLKAVFFADAAPIMQC